MQGTGTLRCWIITEGMAGTENQCLGVAEALGVQPDVRRIKLRQPWRALSPYLGFEQAFVFEPKLEAPWPDLLITSGRKSVAASRYIKKSSGGKTFTVHIQDPRISAAGFDMLAVAEHDPARGENVFTTRAAPNRITDINLELARSRFQGFEKIRRSRVAVLIGGTSKAYTITPAIMRALAENLKALPGGLMITTSRRTGADNESILRETLKGTDAFIWDGRGENPYTAMLAWADHILVTADSVSMLSDAATTGKPVYMIDLKGGGKRLSALHRNLMDTGVLRPFEGRLESWSYEPLRDARRIAEEIHRRMAAGGWILQDRKSI